MSRRTKAAPARRSLALRFGGLGALSAAILGLPSCTQSPPKELAGLWSTSPEACAAKLGVTFRADSVRARFGGEAFTLLDRPRYAVQRTLEGVRIQIDYALPTAPGGVSGMFGKGVVVLEREPGGRLRPVGRMYVDLRTGAAHAPLQAGAIERALTLGKCHASAANAA